MTEKSENEQAAELSPVQKAGDIWLSCEINFSKLLNAQDQPFHVSVLLVQLRAEPERCLTHEHFQGCPF